MSRRVAATLYGYAPIRPGALAVDLAAALATYRAAHGCDPRTIVVSPALAWEAETLDGVPVIADPVVAKPAGVAYLEVG